MALVSSHEEKLIVPVPWGEHCPLGTPVHSFLQTCDVRSTTLASLGDHSFSLNPTNETGAMQEHHSVGVQTSIFF